MSQFVGLAGLLYASMPEDGASCGTRIGRFLQYFTSTVPMGGYFVERGYAKLWLLLYLINIFFTEGCHLVDDKSGAGDQIVPINEQVINNLLDNAVPSATSPRVFFVEPGNLMTAMNYFKRITGQQIGLDSLAQKANGGFFVHTYNGMINGQQVNVTIRGGSSSDVTYTRLVHVLSVTHQLIDADQTSQVAHGVPTLDITNPGALNGVPRIQNAQGRVEFKFTNRFSYEATR